MKVYTYEVCALFSANPDRDVFGVALLSTLTGLFPELSTYDVQELTAKGEITRQINVPLPPDNSVNRCTLHVVAHDMPVSRPFQQMLNSARTAGIDAERTRVLALGEYYATALSSTSEPFAACLREFLGAIESGDESPYSMQEMNACRTDLPPSSEPATAVASAPTMTV